MRASVNPKDSSERLFRLQHENDAIPDSIDMTYPENINLEDEGISEENASTQFTQEMECAPFDE
jgi:hypothetical protein